MADQEKPAVPDGVTVVVLLDNSAMGTASDFEPQAYGGMSLRESQEHRARNGAWAAAFHACCHPHIASALADNMRASTAAGYLRNVHGWREHVIVHGHGDAE